MVDRCLLMFKALSDETRQKILYFLQEGALSVGEIVERTSLAQPTVSHHLNILKQAGVVLTERRGKQIYHYLCCGPEVMDCCSGMFNLLGISVTNRDEQKKGK